MPNKSTRVSYAVLFWKGSLPTICCTSIISWYLCREYSYGAGRVGIGVLVG